MSGFPEKGADLRGSPGNFRGSPGNFRGSLGNFRGSPGSSVKFHSERTSGEVAEKLPGKFGELPGKSGDFPEARGSLTASQRLAKFVPKFQSAFFDLPHPFSTGVKFGGVLRGNTIRGNRRERF